MKNSATDIFNEYRAAVETKRSVGTKGLYDQTEINERFFIGDQWHGARCGAERPLVRHNIIKRIGEFKMSQITAAPLDVAYSAEGIPSTEHYRKNVQKLKKQIANTPNFSFNGVPDAAEINVITSALSDYRRITAERVGLETLVLKALKNSYISGSGIIYTYWNSDINTGTFADSDATFAVKGDIACEVLDIRDVAFGDVYEEDLQRQPYIILSARRNADEVRREARAAGASYNELVNIVPQGDDGKVLVLTKLYKEYNAVGQYKIKCVKVTEKATVRAPYNTGLNMYPLAMFRFEERGGFAYGESEITHLIPNQIAINRMITASVWATMTMGMPLMVVNGDTVTGDITNDPGQIIKIYGSNEDVAGAVKYVTPPDFSSDFIGSVNNLIDNTLTQSGANAAALGDTDPDNASAIIALRNSAVMPLNLLKNRYYAFIEQISRIWADFWVTHYGERKIKIQDENGVWYMPFCAKRYQNLCLNVRVDVAEENTVNRPDRIEMLNTLYEKGIIDKAQYLKRLPKDTVPDINELLSEIKQGEEIKNDG